MKKIATLAGAVLLAATPAFAHEIEGGSTAGLFGLKPEYVHVLINPLPIYGLAIGLLVLIAALIAHSTAARNIGLGVIVVATGSAWPVLEYGQHAYNDLFPQLDSVSQQWLYAHMARAEHFVYAFYVTALLGLGALVLQRKSPKAGRTLTTLTLVASVVSLGCAGYIARAGGQVSHPEFRHGPPPPIPAEAVTESEVPAREATETIPDTVPGIFTAIAEQQATLAKLVQANQLDDVHHHAYAIRDLANALPGDATADHITRVDAAARRIAALAGELDEAGDSGNRAKVSSLLEELNGVVAQLRDQFAPNPSPPKPVP